MNEQAFRAFLNDLIATCQKHGMAIISSEMEGLILTPWQGWGFPHGVNPKYLEGPMMTVGIITTDPDDAVAHYKDDWRL